MPKWLINFLARNTPSCKEVIQLISDSMERPLPFHKRMTVRFHFLICKWCARYRRQLRFIRNILGRNPGKVGQNLPNVLSPEAQERIKQALRPRTK